jgi:hypothetical protein
MLPTLLRTAGLFGFATAVVAVRRTMTRLCLYGVVAILGTAGLSFLTAAAYLALAQALGDIYASLLVGCAYLFAALVALLAAQARRRW